MTKIQFPKRQFLFTVQLKVDKENAIIAAISTVMKWTKVKMKFKIHQENDSNFINKKINFKNIFC
jgi:hypothetical protein